jgi:hypothetical protein
MQLLSDIILVSDGGAMDDYGSFGWVVSTKGGNQLAPVRVAFLAATQGLTGQRVTVLKLARSSLSTAFGTAIYCDNQGLLKKLTYLRSYNNAIHAIVLHSEWDIVSSVHRLQQDFDPPPELQHVKGHQDDGTQIEFLELPSQLNVEADTLATTALHEYGSIKPIVPFDPSSRAQLTINGCTITRQFAKAIHNQQHLAPLCQYYRLRFNWSCDVFEDIDWSQYSMAYRRFPRQRTFFSKLGWKKLPVAGQLHKRNPCYDHRCPTSAADREDDDHVYQCQHVTRSQWGTSFLDKISDKLHPILDPNLMAIIRMGIRTYFNDSPPDFLERFPQGFSSTPYNDVIIQQNAIGWDHFIRGKVSKKWKQVQHQHAKRYGMVKQSEGWMLGLIKLMANLSFQLWELRNQCRHGHDSATRQQSMHDQAHRKI